MRKYLALSALGACLLVALPSTATFAGSSTYYAGKNAQNQKLLFSVDQIGGHPNFDPFFTSIIDRCPATGDTITITFSFQGFEIPIKNGKFNLTLNSITDRFSWGGTVTSTKASGMQSYSLAAFDQEGGLQDCTTGPVSWSAKALVASKVNTTAPRTAYNVTVTKESNGSVRFSVTH
jgi:hypothetical protein